MLNRQSGCEDEKFCLCQIELQVMFLYPCRDPPDSPRSVQLPSDHQPNCPTALSFAGRLLVSGAESSPGFPHPQELAVFLFIGFRTSMADPNASSLRTFPRSC